MTLQIGTPAPDFELLNQWGESVRLSRFRGEKAVAIVFFPLAFSGTCTGELCELRDNLAMFDDEDVALLGISVDSKYSLRAWGEQEGYGFQLLAEARLLPGAHTRNGHQQFICRDQKLRVENPATDWTNGYTEGQQITIPLKNADGRFVADAETITRIEGNGQVVFRYVDVNPNASINDIAGVSNERGNVVGLMPHPEHATELGFGPDTTDAMRSGTDGLTFFTSAIAALTRA